MELYVEVADESKAGVGRFVAKGDRCGWDQNRGQLWEKAMDALTFCSLGMHLKVYVDNFLDVAKDFFLI